MEELRRGAYASDIRELLRRVGEEAERARENSDHLLLGQLVGLAATLRTAEFAAENVARERAGASGASAHVTWIAEEHLP